MRHPDLEGYDPTPVQASQVPFLAASGWVECDPPPVPEPEEDDTDGEKPTAKKAAPRRSTKKDES